MSTTDKELLREAKQFVTKIFTSKVKPAFVFHNLDHTRDVVKACEQAADHYRLNEQERLILLFAAWFHDTGYSNGNSMNHEEASQKIATGFLKERNVDQSIIDGVNACILATKMPQSPANVVQKILCDADLFHLGSENFQDKTKLLRQELNELQDKKVSKQEWRQVNIDFLQKHSYFTDYFRDKLDPIKQKHLKELMETDSKKDKEPANEKIVDPKTGMATINPENVGEIEKVKKEKEKDAKNDRGIVAMFRIMSQNHVSLSQLADSKANIMISVNTIVISILVSVLIGKLSFYPEYIIPSLILVFVCMGAVVFAILATRPNISGGTFTREDIETKKINLLFFGNFFKMELPEYDWAMKEMMKDKEYLYGSMIKDIYFLGIVLARKYKLIRISYNIFMFGLVVAIIVFAFAFIFPQAFTFSGKSPNP